MPGAARPRKIPPVKALDDKPATPRKGRGAVSNILGRYELTERAAYDDGWPQEQDAPAVLRTTVFEERARSIVSRNDSPDIGFGLSINPYRGCEHGCCYCYARPYHAYLGLSPGLDFESKIYAKVNAPELLRAELRAPSYRPELMAVGVVTDAYQPVERELRLTRGCLEVLAEARHPVSLITKSALIERDIDLIGPMAAQRLAFATVSLTTLDPALARRMEPRCAAPARRVETIRRLAQAGIPVGVSVAPLIPFVNEPEIERVLAAAHAAGARWAFYVVIRLPLEVAPLFDQWLRAHFPDRAERVMRRIADMRAGAGAGRINDARFGLRMTGEGPWAELVCQRFRKAAGRLGFERPVPDCDATLFRPPARDARQFALF